MGSSVQFDQGDQIVRPGLGTSNTGESCHSRQPGTQLTAGKDCFEAVHQTSEKPRVSRAPLFGALSRWFQPKPADSGADGSAGDNELEQDKVQRATANSEIPVIREHLTRQGLDGRGVGVAVLEDAIDEQCFEKSGRHPKAVANVIFDPVVGVAPGAQRHAYRLKTPMYTEGTFRDDPRAWLQFLERRSYEVLNNISDFLEERMAQPERNLRVINLSMGTSRVKEYQNLFRDLESTDAQGNYRYPNLRRLIYGKHVPETEEARLQAVINAIDAIHDRSPRLQEAIRRYHEATRKAAQNGLFLVTAVGNEHNKLPSGVKIRPGAGFSYESSSPYVISVANSDSNGTPGYYDDDIIADDSSRGDGASRNPTVAAPGSTVFVGPGMTETDVDHGSSFSTPYVSGVLAIMLQKNPDLTFEQARSILQSTAVKPQTYRPEEMGAGVVNPVEAVAQTPWGTKASASSGVGL